MSNYGRRRPSARTDLTRRVIANSSSSAPDLWFRDSVTASYTKLSTTKVGNRFFAVSTLLTQVTSNSKKGSRRKGEEKKEKEERKAQSKPKFPLAIQTNLDRSKSRFSRQRQEREKLCPTGFTGKRYLTRYSIVTLSLISTLLIATSDMGQFDGFPRPYHLESNHRKHVLDPQFLSMSHLLASFLVRVLEISLKSASFFYSGISQLFEFLNYYKSVHANEGFIGAWKEKTG
ncbi:hypothetical protein K435DRAFT_841535 [Dendrothele bispora CBS 962.96]|uniref:Uncharacterized protein n=1 Tax=Dendrothele bispora (strain CBS 962.96) TaxID=1314807 RepID=A0A4S8LMU3_DENBC|nr:hypothetical protein K435DRAFT_841535 [Dendrothele bispora CBS 962.96]